MIRGISITRENRSYCCGGSDLTTGRGRPSRARELVEFFKNDPDYGGVYLIGGR